MTPALVGITALAAASVQATTGLGFALVLTPVLFALLSPAGAIVAATVLGVELNPMRAAAGSTAMGRP